MAGASADPKMGKGGASVKNGPAVANKTPIGQKPAGSSFGGAIPKKPMGGSAVKPSGGSAVKPTSFKK